MAWYHWLSFPWIAFWVYIMVRTELVSRYRRRMWEQVGRLASQDIAAGRFEDWRWRFEAVRAVGFQEMVWKFWRPLPSFYKDKSFLFPGRAGGEEEVA